jgi:hypothetical protein
VPESTAAGTRYEIPRESACCSAGSASRVGHTVRSSRTGAFGEHVWAGRSYSMGCEPVLVVGRPCDWSGCRRRSRPTRSTPGSLRSCWSRTCHRDALQSRCDLLRSPCPGPSAPPAQRLGCRDGTGSLLTRDSLSSRRPVVKSLPPCVVRIHERAPRQEILPAAERIIGSVDMPMTIDAEAGYGLREPSWSGSGLILGWDPWPLALRPERPSDLPCLETKVGQDLTVTHTGQPQIEGSTRSAESRLAIGDDQQVLAVG